MEVILQQDLDELGLEGDIVKVAKGYARNYLIPKGIALEAISQNIKAVEQRRKKIEVNRLKAKESAEQVKQQLEEIEITIEHKAGEEGKLYGHISRDSYSSFNAAGDFMDPSIFLNPSIQSQEIDAVYEIKDAILELEGQNKVTKDVSKN